MQSKQSDGRLKAALILVVSLGAATLAVWLVFKVVHQAREEVARARQQPDALSVVIARRELNVGIRIGPDDIAIKRLSPEMVPRDSAFFQQESVLGRTPRERILANEIIRNERLAVADAGIGLNAIISPGKRAMAVAVDSESGVAGFLMPGNYVDVIVTIRPDERSLENKWVSHAFLQGVKVLAVGRNMGVEEEADPLVRKASSREKPTVTLELDLEQAQELALSASKGDIHLVLRNDVDVTHVKTHGAITGNLVGLDAPPASRVLAPEKAAPGPQVSEVIQGDRVERVQFDQDGSNTTSGKGR